MSKIHLALLLSKEWRKERMASECTTVVVKCEPRTDGLVL